MGLFFDYNIVLNGYAIACGGEGVHIVFEVGGGESDITHLRLHTVHSVVDT